MVQNLNQVDVKKTDTCKKCDGRGYLELKWV